MDRYTQLLPFISHHDGLAEQVSVQWQLDVPSIPVEILALSWADLLYSFTGAENPVFTLNGAPVKVDLSSRMVQAAALDSNPDFSGKHTALFIGDSSEPVQTASSTHYALSLVFNRATGMGALHSTGGVGGTFLLQIGRQLKQFAHKQGVLSGIEVELPSEEAPEISISNPSPCTLPGPQVLHELVLGDLRGPDTAIEYLSADGTVRSLSYSSLDTFSTKLAVQIAAVIAPLQIDLAHNVIIPVLLPQSLDLYVSYLAILKAGAAFCPLNVDTPLERIQFILKDVAASVVITRGSMVSKLPHDERPAVITTDEPGSTGFVTTPPPWRACYPSRLAYVMYTSGSTGRPKGVGVSHLAVTQSLLAHDGSIPRFQRFLQFASPTFDVSVFEYFFPLMRKATVIACDRETMVRDISRVIRDMDVDAAELTPTVAGELLRTRAAAPSLRVLLTIGEMLTRHVVDEFGQSEKSEGILHGMYGPTEAAIHCTAAPNFQAQSRVNLVGLPLKTVSAYVVSLHPDDSSPGQEPRILPCGQIGELVVGGPQLADGYINRPEENARAFIESPSHGRLYRTGDKARMLPNGELECFGRVSSGQVKLRGQRIELGEIENAISWAANVRSAVAIVINGNLIAFLLVHDAVVSDDEIRRACRQWLPRFMIPGEFILVDNFPQLPSGKIDRKALESEYLSRKSGPSNTQLTFRDATEGTIFTCISQVLNTQVHATESLAAAGLDSLAAIRLAANLREVGLNLEVGRLLEADSLDGVWHLAKESQLPSSSQGKEADLERIWDSVANAGSAKLRSIGLDGGIDAVEPCSHIQQSMIAETVQNSKAYCNFVELECDPSIRFTDFKEALGRVAQQIDTLRSGFIEIGVKDFPYSRFVWNRLQDHIFQRCEGFDYDVSLGDDYGILYPVRVQYQDQGGRLCVLLHIHHALYDGWSWELVLRDLETVLKGNDPAQRPPYKNITKFFIESALSGSASESSIYWQDQLYGMSPAAWPNLNPRADVSCGRGEVTRVLDVPVPKLNEVSQRLRVSRQTIFQAAFGYLLSSYLGTDDVVFGTVFSGRTLPIQGIESIVGPCIRVLPMRLNIGKVQNVGDLILAIHNLNRKSLEHGNLPLHDIKKASGIELNLRLFDNTVVWQETIWSGQQQNTLVRESAAADFLEYAMLLELEPKDGKVHAKATYEKSILPSTQAGFLLEQINHVASVFLSNPDLSLSSINHHLPLSVLSIENEHYEKQVDLPSLASSVEDVASTDPDRLAVEFLHSLNAENGLMSIEGVTYENLNCQANRLAHHLVDLGVRKNDLVAILMDKSVELYVSLLAVFKVGAGYVPITPQSPTKKVHSILNESRSPVCVTKSLFQQEHALCSLKFLRTVDLQNGVCPQYPECNPPNVEDGSSIAYGVFTSGSTGIPKGVLIPYRSVQSNIAVLTELYPSSCGSKMLQACSHGFDVSIFEILFTWRTGMTLCATTNDNLFRDIQHVIRGLNITHLSLTPTVASLVDPREVPAVKFLVSAGEALTQKVHQAWAGKGLHQGYGPSEMTNVCSVCPNIEAWHSPRNIGPPLKNTSVFLVSEHDGFSLTPRGAVGELCFGGDQVAEGYLNMPDLTAERFIHHSEYGKIYRTGDFGRLLPDGSIYFIGRRDDQIKLRGQRIELGEINSVLLSNEVVKDCTSVVLETGNQNQEQLVAFWVPSYELNDRSPGLVAHDLFEKLRDVLPGYMIPSHIVPVDTLPMTENGKADHKGLLQRFQQMSYDELLALSPEPQTADSNEDLSELETSMAAILSDVTGTRLSDIRRNTSFYHVGLDSISAISFSRKLRDGGFGQLDVSTILRQSSVARLSAVILTRNEKRSHDSSANDRLENLFDDNFIQQTKGEFERAGRTVQAIYPCTPLQEAMLSVGVSQSQSAYFNHLLFESYVDFNDLRDVWGQILKRHAIFKTCFKATNNAQFAYAQVVLENIPLPLHYVDVSMGQLDLYIEEQKLQFQKRFQAGGVLPYALTVFWDRIGRKTFLLLSIHHALHDGEAMTLLFQEIQSLLSHQPIPEVIPFESFIRNMISTDINAADGYWNRYLSGVLPSLLAGSKSDESANAAFQSQIDLGTPYDLLKEKCKEISVTPLNVFHTAWARLLSFYLDSPDVCFGNVFSCRTIPLEGADRIVGPCFNTLPIRVNFSSTATNEDIMKLNRRSNSDMLLHQLSSLRRIQRRALGDGSQLFDTLLILQTRPLDLDENLWKLVSEEGNMDFPFICEIIPDEKQNNVHVSLHSRESCISPADGELIVRQFAALVDHILRYPSGQTSDRRPIGNAIPFLPKKVSGRSRKFESLAPVPPQISHQPWSHPEEVVRDALCEFAKIESGRISRETTIFQLGLDSINAVQVAGYLRDLGYGVSAGNILEAASISNISNLLDSSGQVTKGSSFDLPSFEARYLRSTCQQLQISEKTVECLRPCTPVQNGMLAMFSNSNGDIYFNRMALMPSEPLDTPLLKEAWRKAMAKHEMLRTGFVQLQDQRHPFAMITYRKEATDLPWFEVLDPVQGTMPPQGVESVLKNLHLPPWYLVAQRSDSTTILQLSALHAIYDAQSLHLILADVVAACRGESLGDGAPINTTLEPILTESFLKNDEAERFWKGESMDIQPSKFPDLHPFRTEQKELLVNSILCSKSRKVLEDGCQKIGMTLQAAGQAAWARLLSAYTGESSVVFGVVSSGRNLSTAAQDAVFPCLVTMPSPCRVASTNRELLGSILQRNASMIKYQFTPLSKIQHWLRADEGLFDTLFVYQKFSSQKEAAETWRIVAEDTRIDYPVSIEMIPHSTQLELRLTHRGDVVPTEQAIIILEQLNCLIEDCIFSPDSNSNDYSSLDRRLMAITPAKEERIPCAASLLHQFVEDNAMAAPSKIALEFAWEITEESIRKKTWTYLELNSDGNRIARLLQKKGVVPGSMIAICFDKCPEASLGILGVMKAGCAYVALDPNAPRDRKQFILEDSASKILLSTRSKKTNLSALSGVELILLDEPGLLDGTSSSEPTLSRPITAGDTCYCLYTSGTTGTPKGCEITHGNAVQAMLAFQRLFDGHWDGESRWLQFASFHFDVSVLEQYWSWSVGICVTSCPRDLLFEDLPGTIQRLQITHIDLTPSLARLVHPDEAPSLCKGVFITGGEQLKQEILDSWGKYGVIYNGYGPTEVTIGCTMLPRVPENGKPSNIGPQFDNVGSFVFAPGTSTPVIRGGVGELGVSGALVGRGYLNRKELTEERFQYLSEHGERIYRTGDLVRILYDGSFLFLGRIDDQVKLRGQRLEIGEINEVIRGASQELEETATLVVKHPKQSKEQLVSFVTRNTTQRPPSSAGVRFAQGDQDFLLDIKSACHTKLPGYMVPTHIIPMSRLPLSANNKVDMKALKSIYQSLSLEAIQRLAPMSAEKRSGSPEEQTIISVLSGFIEPTEGEILPWTSIYELGLDSISIISFSRRLKDAGFAQSHPSLIMKNPTISGMVSALQASKEATSRTDICENARQNIEAFGHKNFHFIIEHLGITANEVEEIAPCTPLQEGIVYHFLNSGGALYCSSFDFEFREPCDSAKLQNAWFRTQNEAQMLRVRLLPTPDGYAQVVLKDCQLPFFEVFVSSEEEIGDVRGLKFKEWAANLGDLSTNLWVIWLIRSPNKSVMCLNIFHALYDGSSLSRLLEKVARKYLGEDRTAKRELSFFDTLPLGPLCKDPSAESFWKEHLQDCHYKDVPKSHSPGHHSLTQKASISGLERVNKFRKSLNVTEQAVLHACWLLTLQQHFGFVPQLGVVVSGRALDIHEIENVIGPLFNTVPSNINFRGLKTWSDLVQRCHHYHISTIPYQHTPLRDIMKWTRRSQSNHLFDSLFVFRRSDAESTPLAESVWESRDSEAEHEYPLAFEVAHNDNESLSVTIAIQDKVMSMDSVRDILASFERHLYELLRNPSQELPQTMDHTAIEEAEGKTPNDYPQDSHDGSFRWTSQASNIRDIMADLTGVDKQSVGAGTSIFEFGLDSIDAIKLSSRLKKLDIHLPVSIIMRHRTIRGMMEHLASSNHVTQDAGAPSIGQLENRLAEFLRQEIQFPKDACRVLPATPIQEAMVAEMVASDYVHYYNHDILELEPHVDPVKLLDAWKAVVNANPILRTSFVEVWDPKIPISYAQIVHNEGTVDIQKVDLHAQPVDTIIQNQRTRALSALTQRPPLTISLAMSNGKCYLVLSMAHSLYDGWSMDLLHEDVARSYAGVCRQRPPYDDVLGHVLASSGERASKFWRATLANYIPKPFPKGKQAGNDGMTIHRQERAFTHLPTNVDDFCKLHGVTMQALCVTCWALVLAGYVGNPDVVFGLVLSGRNTADSEHVMFPTMNTVAMRAILHGRRIDMVKYVQSTLVDVGEHQHFPLRRARPDIGSRQLFDTLFIYQKGRSGSASKLPRLYKSTGGSASIEFPVCVEIESLAEAVVCRVACRDSVFGSPECLGLLERMEQVLSSILRGPEHQTIEFVDGAMRISGCSVQTCEPRLNGVAHSHVDSSIQDKTEWSSLELRIRNVLSVVSGIPEGEIDKETTIFQLGLDSISAIKVSSLLKKQAVKLTVSDMLKSGTIGKMALAANRKTVELSADDVRTALARSLEGIDSASLLHHRGIGPEQVERILPVTPGQIYFLSMNALNPNAFHPSFYYLASENLNPSVLNGAWERLTEEAAMLRTSFVPTNVKHPPAIQVVMKTALSPVIWNCERQDRVSWESPRGMNRLVPAALFASQTTRGTALQLRVHHALYDGVSLPKIMEMLVAFCSNGSLRPQVDHTQLASFVAFQSIHSPVNVRRQFWEGYLGTNSSEAVKQYQDNYTGPAEHLYRPGLVPNMSKVEEIAKRKSLSIQSIFLAVYAKVHAYAQGRPKDQPKSKPMAVGMYLANRSYAMEGLSDLVAPTVNIVPLRIDDKHGEGSLFAYARKIQEELNEISRVEYSAVSLLEISEWTGIQLDTCINFMKLPEIDGNPNGHQQLRMTPISAEDFQELNSPGENGKMESEGSGFVMETSSQRPNGFATPNGAEDETGHARANGTTDGLGGLREVFKPTMDVEAAIRNDRLDLGVFGLRSRLGGKLAESVIDGICQEMSRLTEGNEDADEDEDGHGHGHGV